MIFSDLDTIYNYILESHYDKLDQFNTEDINVVLKLKFPDLSIDTCKKSIINVRTNSIEFRKDIISKYKHCPFTNLCSNICEAAHILPYSDCIGEEKYNVNNGILLSPNLHKMFDKNYFIIDEISCKLKILYKNIRSDNIDISTLNLKEIENMYIKQLDNPISKKFIRRRNMLIK